MSKSYKLIDELNGDKELLKKLAYFMYFLNKEVARNGFNDFLYANGLTVEEWKIFKEWLLKNGLKTYN